MQYQEVAGGICAPKGFAAAGVHCGIRANHAEKYDLALIKADVRCAAAGVYTTNKVCGAPIKVDRAHLKDGYAQDAAALLQTGYEQILSYSRMYNMDLQKVLQARLFVNGNYVALLILGAQGDWEASDEDQAKFAADEAAKADAVWSGIFGSADNSITIPEDDGSSNGGFFDMGDDELPDGEIMIGG